jgi:hypothetical protein
MRWAIVILLGFLGCFGACKYAMVRSDDTPSVTSLKVRDALVVYTFTEDLPYLPPPNFRQNWRVRYCLKNVYMELGQSRTRVAFHDDYDRNYQVSRYLKENQKAIKYLEKKLDVDPAVFFPIVNSPKRLDYVVPDRRVGDTSYKFEWGNIYHFYTITSEQVYLNPSDSTRLYIAFNISGDFFYYRNLHARIPRTITSRLLTWERGMCTISEHWIASNFVVVDKITKMAPLTTQQMNDLEFVKSPVDTIRIFFPE